MFALSFAFSFASSSCAVTDLAVHRGNFPRAGELACVEASKDFSQNRIEELYDRGPHPKKPYPV